MLKPVRSLLGLGQAEIVFSAAAPLPPEVGAFFAGLGLRILDVYGMTETTGAFTANTTTQFRLGTVGRPLPAMELKIADDGEILTRGPLNTPGYLNLADQTAALIDDGGWLHTGDIGTVDEDGFLSVVDRKKELIITAGGENIAPAAVENVMVEHPLIGQALAFGDRRPYVVALLTLDSEVAPGLGGGPRDQRRVTGRTGRAPGRAGRGHRRGGRGQPAAGPGAAGEELAAAAGGVDRGERRADPDAEAQAPGRAREVRRRDRHALRCWLARSGPLEGAAFPPRLLGAPSSRLIARRENSAAALRSLAGFAGGRRPAGRRQARPAARWPSGLATKRWGPDRRVLAAAAVTG